MTIKRIRIGSKEVVLVGTAHISAQSVQLAQETIISEQPDVVGIELDEQRFHQLKNETKWQATNISQVVRTGKTYLLLLNIFLTNLQRRLGENVGVKPGMEMLMAEQTAREHRIPVALLDRNIQITMQRTLTLLGFKEKIKLFFYLLSGLFSEKEQLTKEKIEEIKQQDVVTQLITELSQKAPTVKKVLVDERDEFITQKILQTPARKIVCIIGAGHLNGITKRLQNPRPSNTRELLRVPKKKNTFGFLKWVLPLVFVIVLAFLFTSKGLATGLSFIGYWILVTGTFSALGALMAKSHPATIATAFLAAPLTTLHPFLASGWFAAGVEAKYRKPLVRDFQLLTQLNSYRDFEGNRVTHLLLVASYTNIGSTIGVLAAFPYIISLLG